MLAKLFSRASLFVPTPKKLVLTAIFFFLVGWIVWPAMITSIMTDWYPVGFPFAIHAEGLCPPTYICVDFRWSALIIDVLVWYTVSAILINARLSFLKFCLSVFGVIFGIPVLVITTQILGFDFLM
jgi:hypothetical protein